MVERRLNTAKSVKARMGMGLAALMVLLSRRISKRLSP